MLRFTSLRWQLAGTILAISLVGSAEAQPAPPADSIARRRIQPLPALASAPETGLQYGATVLAVWEPAPQRKTRPTSVLAAVLRTSKQQTRIRAEAEHWSDGNARRVAGSLQWQKFPLPYYGVGDRTEKSSEELFTPKGVEAVLSVQQRAALAWYITGGARYVDQKIVPDTAGVLQLGRVHGSTGGRFTEFSVGVMTDTRDNLFAPRSGRWVQLTYGRSVSGLLADFAFGTARLDARMYQSLRTEHVLATQVQLTGTDGVVPFDQMALAGNGDILRGYARGRFRDRWVAAAQSEYRTPVRHRIGAVAFAGAGVALPSLDAWSGRTVLPTYGAGLRVQIDQRQRTGVRVDYGRGRDGAAGLYIGFNQAF